MVNLGDLKTCIEDFIVVEAFIPSFSSSNSAEHNRYYYELVKCNYTTFEAIVRLAKFFQLNVDSIEYLGLKDEDGITKQNIALTEKLASDKVALFNEEFNEHSRYIMLKYSGSGNKQYKIGQLLGNNFRIVVRKLNAKIGDTLSKLKRKDIVFINYYGPQRFGLPNCAKTTHLMGKCLLDKKYDEFINYLAAQPNELGMAAKDYRGDPVLFLDRIPKNQLAFYQSSYYSHLWNEKIHHILNHDSVINYQQCTFSDIDYQFSEDASQLYRLLADNQLNYTAIRLNNNKLYSTTLSRPILVQSRILCNWVKPDELNHGYICSEFEFFLPSGCYATIAIPQFIFNIIASNTSATKLSQKSYIDTQKQHINNTINQQALNFHTVLPRLYRSGCLSSIDKNTAHLIQHQLNIECHIDLRSTVEKQQSSSPHTLEYNSIESQNFPLGDFNYRLKHVTSPSHHDYYAYYSDIIDGQQQIIADIIHYIASCKYQNFLISCHLGKDRTGIIVMLLLGLLQVPEIKIIENFERSEMWLTDNVDRLEEHWLKRNITKEIYAQRFGMATIGFKKLLDKIKYQYDGFENYALSIGLTQTLIASLRENFAITAHTAM